MDERESVSSITSFIRQSYRRLKSSRSRSAGHQANTSADNEANNVESLKEEFIGQGPVFTKYCTLEIGKQKVPNIKFIEKVKNCEGNSKVKAFMRKANLSISNEIRTRLWTEVLKTNDNLSTIYTDNAVCGSVDTKGHPLFSGRMYHLNSDGVLIVGRLLDVIKRCNTKLLSCPDSVITSVASLLLHYFDNVNHVYHYIDKLLVYNRPDMSLVTLVQRFGSSRAIVEFIKSTKPKVYAALHSKLGDDMGDNELAFVIDDWKHWIFSLLPFYYMVLIMDSYLVEGPKVLLRIIITLLSLWRKKIDETVPLVEKNKLLRAIELRGMIRDFIKNFDEKPEALMKMAFNIKNFGRVFILETLKKYSNEVSILSEPAEKIQQEFVEGGIVGVISSEVSAEPFKSNIIYSNVALCLMSYLPSQFMYETPELLYRSSRDGISFSTLWNKIENACSTLIVLKTDSNDVIGAYCSTPWNQRRFQKTFFGNDKCYLFKIDEDRKAPIIYKHSFTNDAGVDEAPRYFLSALNEVLCIGGGGGGIAILLEHDLSNGSSTSASTFKNPQLTSERNFAIDEMEVFGVGGQHVR